MLHLKKFNSSSEITTVYLDPSIRLHMPAIKSLRLLKFTKLNNTTLTFNALNIRKRIKTL